MALQPDSKAIIGGFFTSITAPIEAILRASTKMERWTPFSILAAARITRFTPSRCCPMAE